MTHNFYDKCATRRYDIRRAVGRPFLLRSVLLVQLLELTLFLSPSYKNTPARRPRSIVSMVWPPAPVCRSPASRSICSQLAARFQSSKIIRTHPSPSWLSPQRARAAKCLLSALRSLGYSYFLRYADAVPPSSLPAFFSLDHLGIISRKKSHQSSHHKFRIAFSFA